MANDIKLEEACKKVFGITSRRYRQLANEGAVPPVVKGKIDILLACKHMLQYYRALAQGQGSMSLLDERVKISKIDRERKELELRRMRGELIEADRAMHLWGKVIHAIRQKLLAIPVKLSPMVLGVKSLPKIRNRIDEFVREVLVELGTLEPGDRRAGSRVGGDKGSARNVPAAAKTKRKRVGRRKKGTKSGVVSRTR